MGATHRRAGASHVAHAERRQDNGHVGGDPGEQAAAKYSSVNEPRSSNGSLRHQHREATDRRTRFTLGDNLAMTQALETLVFFDGMRRNRARTWGAHVAPSLKECVGSSQ